MPVSASCACGLAYQEPQGVAYNEEAFRHLLSIERRRDARANRATVLVVIRLRRPGPDGGDLPAAVAEKLLGTLARAVREVDFVGWIRDGRVAGAVLAQGGQNPAECPAPRIGTRLEEALRRQLPVAVAARLQSRAVRLAAGTSR
jgi:hypothetical protein